jgi:crotonobetainyl-CoA:carnitine CoA-transferase CaiB-like acyl-CoA transferase
MPLSHLRVLDFTQVRAGPTCTKILADFGAEVIRIERLGEPDRAREPFGAVDLQRGKKSILLDLGTPAGPEVVHRLVPSADVVVENSAPSPLPGQHTREILNAAGYDAVAIDRLLAEKVAAETPLP